MSWSRLPLFLRALMLLVRSAVHLPLRVGDDSAVDGVAKPGWI